ncbi:glycosyltransferase family 39 protein, partial [Thermoflexus hugenholtzii]
MEGTPSHPTRAQTGLLIREKRVCCERARSWGRPRSAAVLLIWLTAVAALALMPAELALYDENHVLWQIVSYPPTGVIRNLMRDSHPPLYYLLAQGWLALGGFDHPWAFRVLSLFLGLPALPLAFQIGCRLGGPRLGLSALTLLALNPWFLFLLILIRMYGLTATLGAWSIWIVLRLLDRPTPRRWAIWTLAQGLLLFTHYYGALLIAALWLTLLRCRPRGWPQGLLLSIPAAALFALWLRQAYAGSLEHTVRTLSAIPARPGPVEVVWHYGATALMGPFVDGVFARAASLALALGLSLTILVRRPRLRGLSSREGELAIWVGLPLLLGALLALRWPFFAARYFAMLTVPGAVALAVVLRLLRRRVWIPAILALGLIGLSRFPVMAAQPLGLSGLDALSSTLATLNRSDPVLAQARWHIDFAHRFYEWTDPGQRTAVMEEHPGFWFVGVTLYAGEWLSWLEGLQSTHFIDFAATYPHPIPEYG